MSKEINQYLTGNTDNGKAINMNAESPNRNIAALFEHKIMPVEIDVEVKLGNNIGLFISYDNDVYKQIGRLNRGINRISIDTDPESGDYPRCNSLRLAFRDFSKLKTIISTTAILYYELEDFENVGAAN